MGLCFYLNYRKGTALPQHTRSCSSRDRKSAEYPADSVPGGRGSDTWAVRWAIHYSSGPHWFPHPGGQTDWGLSAWVFIPVQFASSKLRDQGRSLNLLPICYNGDNNGPHFLGLLS